jgi:ParB-like chromosome segregation protein Spo0J
MTMQSILAFHPVANVFPIMTEAELVELAADILAHGLKVPIVLYCGRILDGRNRYIACLKIGYEPTYVEYTDNDPVHFSLSLNLQRRHLDAGQRAAIAVDLANLRLGRFHGNQYSPAQNCVDHPSVSQKKAADQMGVSLRTVSQAAAVKRADPNLHQKVKTKEISLQDATRALASQKERSDESRKDNTFTEALDTREKHDPPQAQGEPPALKRSVAVAAVEYISGPCGSERASRPTTDEDRCIIQFKALVKALSEQFNKPKAEIKGYFRKYLHLDRT